GRLDSVSCQSGNELRLRGPAIAASPKVYLEGRRDARFRPARASRGAHSAAIRRRDVAAAIAAGLVQFHATRTRGSVQFANIAFQILSIWKHRKGVNFELCCS